ncbi:MAG: transposase [Bacteroidota bacterium]
MPFAVCNACPVKEKCAGKDNLNNSKGRPIERSEYEDDLQANRARVAACKDYYCQRQAIVEHPFGTIKRGWGFDYTLLKGLEKVDAEFALIATCYNLKRVTNLFGVHILL